MENEKLNVLHFTSKVNLSVGHIGLGHWGKNILRNLYELGVLGLACDISEELIKERKKEFPEVTFTNKIQEVLENKKIKAVVISTPARTHYEIAKMALLADKDVFIEKPLAMTVKEGEELIKIAEEKGRIIMVGHILNYHPAIVKMKEIIKKGEIGKIQYIYSNRINLGKIRTEEDVILSLAPHDISLINNIVGSEPIEVKAEGSSYLTEGIIDIATINLHYLQNIKAHIFVSWLNPYKEHKLVIIGSNAMLVFDDVNKELQFYPHKIEWVEGKIPVVQKMEYQVIPVDTGEPLKLELSHFLECVAERKKPLTDGEEGLKVLKVLESAKESAYKIKSIDKKAIIQNKYFVHESSYIDEGVVIGEGTKIWHFSHILKGSSIGKNCIIGQNVVIGPDVVVGDRCKIQNNVSVYKGVTLEDEVFCGPSCVFTNVYNPRAFIERKHEFKSTLIKKGATIGANATIVCGVTVGSYAMIGAGAVVKTDIPDYAIVAGVPARQIGWACKCGTTLKFNNNKATCSYCGNEYKLDNNKLEVIKEI